MRVPFPPQPSLDTIPIAAVPLNTNCRDEIIPILAALQHLYASAAARDQLLGLIARDVNGTTKATCGRPGLTYWQILVLAAVRLGCNLDYDKLQNLAEEHNTLRRIMGIGTWADDVPAADRDRFDWRRLRDNLCLIRPETLEQLNTIVVNVGHRLEPHAPEKVRGDSFVVETNIHYPTDAGVLVDGLRKVLQLAVVLATVLGAGGWRQEKQLQRRLKKLLRLISEACKSKKAGAIPRRKQAYRPLLKLARKLLRRAGSLLVVAERALESGTAEDLAEKVRQLREYLVLTEQVASTARRRVLGEETVPNAEKIFSVFEPHTELVNRGKTPQAIEFGRRVLTIEDLLGFVVHYAVVERGHIDHAVGVEALRQAQAKVGGKIQAASFDRGFHSPSNQREFAEVVDHPCVPVRGSRQAARQEATATEEYRQNRRRHPGVESLIHSVQAGNGLERCRDRTEQGLKRYVGLAMLGRNLHVLGRLVLAKANPECAAAQSKRQRSA